MADSTKTIKKTEKPALAKKITWESLRPRFDPAVVQMLADEELDKPGIDAKDYGAKTPIFSALTLKEFENGLLLSESFQDEYKTFAIDLSRKLQKDYGCETTSEKATAELAANAYVRTLQAQTMITKYLRIGTFTDIGVKYLAVLSSELDRANRHYIIALQTLACLKQAPLNITVNAKIANIAHQQIIQENHNVKPK